MDQETVKGESRSEQKKILHSVSLMLYDQSENEWSNQSAYY